jgi:hypothetical protein
MLVLDAAHDVRTASVRQLLHHGTERSRPGGCCRWRGLLRCGRR